VQATADQAGPDYPQMSVTADGTTVGTVEVQVERPQRQVYTFNANLRAGNNVVGISFLNDYYDPNFPNPKRRDRNLAVDWFEVEGPLELTGSLPASHVALIGATQPKDHVQHAREVFQDLLTRAYRRPAKEEETNRLVTLYTDLRKRGLGYEKAMQIGLAAVLCNPNFLFRIERPTKMGDLSPYEIASRLSYFLWSSMPDAELISAAASGKLATTQGVRSQVIRMLGSSKSDSLGDEFASQWLQLRKLEATESDQKTFPEATKSIRSAMATEARMLFMDIVKNDRPVTDLLTTNETYVNGELANLYGIPGVTGPRFVKATHTDRNRGGIVGMAAFLTVTSNPNRTSPVKRGRFVLEEILGTPPPPPPPNVGALADGSKPFSEVPIKERMAEHRKNPACANCHRQMDAIGFSLEAFNGIGKARTMDGKFPVDATGEVDGGKNIDGAAGLRDLLAARKEDFARAFIEKLMTFALGRGLEPADKCHVDAAFIEAKKDNFKFASVVRAIVSSPPFTHQSP
ncbi:MAG: DUF1592 domain-containing protein, partial [bacterium]